MPNAKITLTISSFNAGGTSAISAVAVAQNSAGNRVYQNPPGGTTVCIKSKGKTAIDIDFAVVDTAGTSYAITNIAFKNGRIADTNGTATFTGASYTGGVATITDNFVAQPIWDYNITISNGTQTSRIDPGIINTDEN